MQDVASDDDDGYEDNDIIMTPIPTSRAKKSINYVSYSAESLYFSYSCINFCKTEPTAVKNKPQDSQVKRSRPSQVRSYANNIYKITLNIVNCILGK